MDSNMLHLSRQYFREETQKRGEMNEREQAAVYAQCVEKCVLKSPATAVFPSLEMMTVSGSDGHYRVSGYVDAQNAYGTCVRENYSYNVSLGEDGWYCTNTFESTEKSIERKVTNNAIKWWVLGIIGTLIAGAFFYFQTKWEMGDMAKELSRILR